MSGGRYSINPYMLDEIIEDIDFAIKDSDEHKGKEQPLSDWDFHYDISDEAKKELIKGREIIKLAKIYINRIDYFLSGDDGNESFIKRIEEDKQKEKWQPDF